MAKRTDREFHIALGKLLDRVRVQNSWSKDSFIKASTHVANITKSEACRFFHALDDMNLLIPGSDKRRLTPNFDTVVWKNEDKRIGLVKEVLELHPDILQSRGRVKGKHYPKRTISHVEEVEIAPVEVVQEEIVNPLAYFAPQDLVAELRDRGYSVTCVREIVTIETL
jgi:hypothetical protein